MQNNIEWHSEAKVTFPGDGKEHELKVIGGKIVVYPLASGREEIQLQSGNFIPTDEAMLLRSGIECALTYPAGSEKKSVRFRIVDWVDGTRRVVTPGIVSGFLLVEEIGP